MNNNPGEFLIFLLIAVMLMAGCVRPTTPAASVPAPAITPSIPIPAISAVILPSIIPTTPTVTPTTSIVPVKTLLPKGDPTDVSEITFSYYYDSDFSVEYPSTWTTATSIYTPYSVGPFYLYDDPRFNQPYRVVTITSPDNTKKFVALTQDLERAGSFSLDPTIDWSKGMFQRDYPDL